MTQQTTILAKGNGETLSEHTIRCLEIAESVLSNLPFEENVIASIKADVHDAIAVHDVGKAAIGFQKSLQPGAERWGHRHEVISAAFASFQKLREEAVFAVLTHHRAIPAGVACSSKGCLGFEELPLAPEPYPVWFKMAREWEQNKPALLNEWNKIYERAQSEKLSPQAGLDCLTLANSWLDRDKQSRKIGAEKRLYASLLRGLVMSCDHVGSSGISLTVPKIPILSQVNFAVPCLFGFQTEAGNVKGNLILQAPTGSGKTLAALLWAGRNQKRNGRLFYALPNTASINAMYLRLCHYFGKANVGLLHSRAVSSLYTMLEREEDSPFAHQKEAAMARSLAKELWYPIRVCTPHQVLRYTLHGKGWELMLSEFPNSCFVFDEIHAYDPRVTGFVIATAKLLAELSASCLFLSATMPNFLKQMISSELPGVSFVSPRLDNELDSEIIDKKRHSLQLVDGNILDNIDTIVKAAEKSSSTLVVCNHVPSAQHVYEELKNKGVSDVLLLHSRFCRRDRDRIEGAIQGRLPRILVATQVVEVSLDVDFEQGFFEPAPIDATIQRLGRVNRKGIRPPSCVTVFADELGRRHPVYSKELVSRSINELQSLPNPLRERDLVEAADRVYQSGYSGEDFELYRNALNHPLIRDYKERLVAGSHTDWTDEVIEKSDGTLDLLPISLKSEHMKLLAEGLWLEADQLLVPVRTGSLTYLNEYVDKRDDPWVINKPYYPTLGLCLQSSKSAE